jgi:hypothetical protein
MKTLIGFMLFAIALCAQTTRTPPGPATAAPATAAVDIASLPAYTLGSGLTWTRGGSSTLGVDMTIGMHIGKGQWYWYSDIFTPISNAPGNAAPATSSITTGGMYLPFCTASQSICFGIIGQGGFSNVAASSTVAPALSGSLALFIHVYKNVWIAPYAKASNASTSPTSGALATAVFQPGVQLVVAFGGK